MSYFETTEPDCSAARGSVELEITPRERDLGGFSVRRILPSGKHRMVGPFIFFDHIGPAEFPPGAGIQVRPHPHVCLATVTYLFAGEIIHRDSLGFVQAIRPGAVNLMTAGRGIVHSERAGDDLDTTSRLHGIQSWIALPDEHEEVEPAFEHYGAGDIPELELDSVTVRVVIGAAYGRRSPVRTHSPTLYLDCRMPAGTQIELPADPPELAAYIVSGEVAADDKASHGGTMIVARAGKSLCLRANQASHVIVIGGEPPGERHIWWNFVASSKQRIEQAKNDWKEGRFAGVPGETEFIPLPDDQ